MLFVIESILPGWLSLNILLDCSLLSNLMIDLLTSPPGQGNLDGLYSKLTYEILLYRLEV